MEEPIVPPFSGRKAERLTAHSVATPLPTFNSNPWSPGQEVTHVARFDILEPFHQGSFPKIMEYHHDIRMGLGGTMLASKFLEGIPPLLVEVP